MNKLSIFCQRSDGFVNIFFSNYSPIITPWILRPTDNPVFLSLKTEADMPMHFGGFQKFAILFPPFPTGDYFRILYIGIANYPRKRTWYDVTSQTIRTECNGIGAWLTRTPKDMPTYSLKRCYKTLHSSETKYGESQIIFREFRPKDRNYYRYTTRGHMRKPMIRIPLELCRWSYHC